MAKASHTRNADGASSLHAFGNCLAALESDWKRAGGRYELSSLEPIVLFRMNGLFEYDTQADEMPAQFTRRPNRR